MKNSIIPDLYSHFLKHPVVCTDSRKIQRGCLFFSLKGENFNGNKFAFGAIRDGASLAVVDEPEYKLGENYFLVDDVLKTLQELANYHREQLKIPVIAITGSNGKTTTKELVRVVLSKKYKVYATNGNLNNHIGVPLTLLSMPADTEIAIIEMGANHQKEIAILCRIAQPTHGIVTNVGEAHLEGFGGFEGVKKGKGELYDYLASQDGTAFVNADNKHLDEMSSSIKKRIFYGYRPSGSCWGEIISDDVFLSLRWKCSKEVAFINTSTHLPGKLNFENILAAVSVGNYFEVPQKDISDAVSEYVPSNMRGQIIVKKSNSILLDTYNANPSSMKAALQDFASGFKEKRKIVVLGDMMELGDESAGKHREVVEFLVSCRFSEVALIGEKFGEWKSMIDCKNFNTTEEAGAWLSENNFHSSVFLIKGSRKMQLEKLVDYFPE